MRRVADAVFAVASAGILVYVRFGHPGDRAFAAISVGYLALLLTSVLVYRLSGVAFRQMFRVRRFRKQPAPPVDASMDTAHQLAVAGSRIQAIKMVRQLRGMALKEAVAVVKEMERKPRS